MPRWFGEDILIAYWEECCHRYRLPDGRRILSATRNPRLSGYPDIIANKLDDGTTVPAEIEWTTSTFGRHGHDLTLLRRCQGFLIVADRDAAFPSPQVVIKRDDVCRWLGASATKTVCETFGHYVGENRRPSAPLVFAYYIKDGKGERNLRIALEHGCWGLPDQARNRSLASASMVRSGDLLVALCGFQGNTRTQLTRLRGIISNVRVIRIASGYYEERDPSRDRWPDRAYPHRFDIDREPVAAGMRFAVGPRVSSSTLRSTVHRLTNNQALIETDPTVLVEVLSKLRAKA